MKKKNNKFNCLNLKNITKNHLKIIINEKNNMDKFNLAEKEIIKLFCKDNKIEQKNKKENNSNMNLYIEEEKDNKFSLTLLFNIKNDNGMTIFQKDFSEKELIQLRDKINTTLKNSKERI